MNISVHKKEKDMKKTVTLGICLFLVLTFFSACKNEKATLESMKKTLQNAGYTIVENYAELYEFHEDRIQSFNGFSFVFAGEHGNMNIPVLEFKDNISLKLTPKVSTVAILIFLRL